MKRLYNVRFATLNYNMWDEKDRNRYNAILIKKQNIIVF